MKRLILILLILLNFGCINRQPAASQAEAETIDSTSTDIGHPIDYHNTEVLKRVYVVDRKGLEARQDPNPQSVVLATYEYGQLLEVIEETADYYGIPGQVTRQYKEGTSTVVSHDWEKIYVLKAQVGPFEQIKLCAEDLNIIGSLSKNIDGEMQSTFYEKPEALNGYLTIELIDKQLFDAKKSTAVNFLTADTTVIVKKEGKITLPCTHTTVEYEDNESDGESWRKHTYIGQIDFLNTYVVEGSYYENWDCQLINKTTGEALSVTDYPHISPDKKYMICIAPNPYDGTAELEIYTIRGETIDGLIFATFANWIPVESATSNPPFWSSDNYLYLTVNHTKAYWQETTYNDRYQYLRMRIVNPD